MEEIVQAKALLREQIISARKSRNSYSPDLFTRNLEKVVAEVNPKRVAIYQAYKSEPQTEDFIKNLKLPVLVPITVDAENLKWQQLGSLEETEIASGDLIFIPALAVDKAGNRLGRGKAYFDRALAKVPSDVLIYAVVFAEEFLDEIPVEAHDRQVNGVVSELAVHKIN